MSGLCLQRHVLKLPESWRSGVTSVGTFTGHAVVCVWLPTGCGVVLHCFHATDPSLPWIQLVQYRLHEYEYTRIRKFCSWLFTFCAELSCVFCFLFMPWDAGFSPAFFFAASSSSRLRCTYILQSSRSLCLWWLIASFTFRLWVNSNTFFSFDVSSLRGRSSLSHERWRRLCAYKLLLIVLLSHTHHCSWRCRRLKCGHWMCSILF